MDTRRCGSTSTETVPARVSTSLGAGRPRAAAFRPGRPRIAGAGRADGCGPAAVGVCRNGPKPLFLPPRPPCGASGAARGCHPGVSGPGRGTPSRGGELGPWHGRAHGACAGPGGLAAVVTTVALSAVTRPAHAAPEGNALDAGLPGSGGGRVATPAGDAPASSATGRRRAGAHGAIIGHLCDHRRRQRPRDPGTARTEGASTGRGGGGPQGFRPRVRFAGQAPARAIVHVTGVQKRLRVRPERGISCVKT